MQKRLSIPILLAALAPTLGAQTQIDAALTQWREQHGAGWRVDIDEGTGYAEFLFGAKVPSEAAPRSELEWFLAAREALSAAQALHGVELATLLESRSAFLPLGTVGSSDKMTLRFRQEVNGVPVEGGAVNVLFDMRGSLLSVQTRALPAIADMDTRASITSDAASFYASEAFEQSERRTGVVQAEPRLVIAQVEQPESRIGVLAWRVDVLSELDGDAVGYTYFVDAKTGRIAQRENLVHHFDVGGTVYTMATPGSYPDSGTNPPVQQPMKYARLTSSAGTVTTDANGAFNFVGATGPLNITCTYDGTFNNVTNTAGSDYSLVFNAATGTGNSIVLNNAPSALVTAQSNIFQACNELRDFIRSVNPTDATGDLVYTANANIASTCNAFFNGSSINFYQAGGGCVNTGFSNVVYHEAGHWLNVLYGTGNGSDGMGEGNADIYAMYLQDDPIIGHDFFGLGSNVRDGNNTAQFCGDSNPGCQGGVHASGQVWMGAAWKVRTRLKNTLGVAPGGAVANSLFFGWLLAYNQTQIKSVNETQWLTLDDDDGLLANGTPHYADIDGGFRQQGFPGYTLPAVAAGPVTQLPNTTNQSGPYLVNARATSNIGASLTGVTLHYRLGLSGPFSSLPMSPTGGGQYSAGIPGQIAPARVQYYVEATDALGNTGRFPDTAPATNLTFAVGSFSVVLCDDFESNLGWSVVDTAISTGTWERGNPIGSGAQPEDDNPAGAGTQCYFTDQGSVGGSAGSNDVDGGPTVLTSPVLDLSAGLSEISYAYWMYNDDGDDSLVVELSGNGSTWVAARTYTGGAGGWATDTIAVESFITPTATTRIRFVVADNPNNSITEAAIDDVCVSTIGPVGCIAPTTYCTAKVNSLFCTPSIAFTGTPSASSATPFDLTASQVLNNKTSVLFYGFTAAAAPFQGGTLCVQPPFVRTPPQSSGGTPSGNDCTGAPTFDMNARIQGGTDPNLVAGATVFAQYYYRDPSDAFTVGLTDAVSFVVCP